MSISVKAAVVDPSIHMDQAHLIQHFMAGITSIATQVIKGSHTEGANRICRRAGNLFPAQGVAAFASGIKAVNRLVASSIFGNLTGAIGNNIQGAL
ncbi:hypothetical protein [Microbulbifer sp. THAF38]|uniref:hypothetical protein n=1 Tax=Microbulbifer sp. THAF38 TaxID=2587856 RepID=UPI0012684896|nr:hypothetical protein [Microbulbifer sp. THAF38]QFT55193.1 hypothetical protein FIU95_11555 [Microbulbifer sp. THAF38]